MRQILCSNAKISSNIDIKKLCKISRRKCTLSLLTTFLSQSYRIIKDPEASQASLVIFPVTSLNNDYYLVRAGESEAESLGFIDTNPVNKTSMTNGLSELGKKQVINKTYQELVELNACTDSCWFWPSITQNSYQTAEILAYLFGVTRDRIVPEYSFLDQRGLGKFDGQSPEESMKNIHDIDIIDNFQRPPREYTGTPNESVEDVLVRVRQLLSITETQYYGSSIVIISSDSENLTVLQSAILGEDMKRHFEKGFKAGQVRKLEVARERPASRNLEIECKRPPNCR